MIIWCSKSSFISAAEHGNLESVEEQLRNFWFKKDWLSNGKRGSALRLAAFEGHTEVVKRLIEAGAEVNLGHPDDGDTTPLDVACFKGHLDVVAALIEAGADPNIPAKVSGYTSLHFAIQQVKTEIVDYLLQHGAKTDIKNSKGQTPLGMAFDKECLEIARALLEADADPNILDSEDNTLLHRAVSQNRIDFVELLLQHGAKTEILNKIGQTPLDIAKEKKYADIETVLKQHMGLPTGGEFWIKMGDDEVAHVKTCPEIHKKITEVFNFTNRERILNVENLETHAESTAPAESFDNINEDIFRKAFDAFTQQGGVANERFVFSGARGLKNKLGN